MMDLKNTIQSVKTTSITSIDFSLNPIGAEGAKALVQALKMNPSVPSIDTLKVCNGEVLANSIATINIGNVNAKNSENLENSEKLDFENMDVNVSVLSDTLTESHIPLLGQEDHLPS